MSYLSQTVTSAVNLARSEGSSQFVVRDLQELAYISAELRRHRDIESRFDTRSILVTVNHNGGSTSAVASCVVEDDPEHLTEVIEAIPLEELKAGSVYQTVRTNKRLSKLQKQLSKRQKRLKNETDIND